MAVITYLPLNESHARLLLYCKKNEDNILIPHFLANVVTLGVKESYYLCLKISWDISSRFARFTGVMINEFTCEIHEFFVI